MNWKKLESLTRGKNASFQFSFCELGKKLSLRFPSKNPNVESTDDVNNTMSHFEFHC